MTTNSTENSNSKKSLLIGFIIGFVVAFAVVYYWFNKSNDDYKNNGTEITAGELMQQQSAESKSAEKPALTKSNAPKTFSGQIDELGTLLITKLFSDDEKARKQAKKEMVKQFHNDPAVMEKLIERCSEEFDKKDRNDNGLFQSIDVFLMVAEKNTETLRQHKTALYAFFEKTKGQYRERTQERIEKVKRLIGE